MAKEGNFLVGAEVDRVAHRRRDPVWLAEQWLEKSAVCVPVWRSRHLIAGQEAPRAVLPGAMILRDLMEASPTAPDEVLRVFLGLREGIPCFAVDLSSWEDPLRQGPLADAGEFLDLRQIGSRLERGEGALLAYARGMMSWHRRHRFCGLCGAATRVEEGGHVRRCTDRRCATAHFPRTDPAVIMLVARGDRCLLGRHKDWPPGVYSTLAGFVEAGESLEEAVAREVFEEAGVRVGAVRYHASQPWPFPSSLMLGFFAEAVTETIRRDPEELEDARWFSREAIAVERAAGTLKLPRRMSIARALVEKWLRDESA